MNTYQGGIPISTTRYAPYQRGSGFLSSIGRFLIPLAKSALPHVARAVGDVVSGESLGKTLKTHGLEAGKDMLRTVADNVAPPPRKNYKRKAPPPKKSNQTKKTRWS